MTPSLTVKEAATCLRLSPAAVYGLCAAKLLRHQRVGVGRGKILIPPDAIDEYLARGTVRSAESHPGGFLFSAARK
ncbi:helix-turn-helix domain-containing protein [Limnoglobus roseus]|uniref:helix-turn-helix domain-containing protein n=1 Tax=Limnoglobus roseus TaxID=2598579 RepID=UPI00143CC4F0|nr:helix-turn-helix domain-containing protein [Limnoglobus roseus]